ncbi:PAS domain-containing sensor histidine kinase [Hydrotalea flava]|uniref:PAS domain-containing sensor histidine kinase n=1 Tax=Hydrotalea flava TaxID=714549 RepID=UPI00142E9227|nr:PAS domain S-box protein [Hydrotalea flava]
MKNNFLSCFATTLVLATNARVVIENIWPEETLHFKNNNQWLKKKFQNLIVAKERSAFTAAFKNFAAASLKKITIKTVLQNEKGKKFSAEITIQKIKKLNVPLQYVFTIQNIQPVQNKTKSFPVELLLRENIIDNVHAIIVILDHAGNITYLNKAGEQITGYQLSSVLHQNWFKIFIPENEQLKALQVFKNLKTGKQAIDFENTILTKKQIPKTIQWKNTPIYSGGTFKGTLSVGMDISDLKNTIAALQQSEHNFKSLTEALPVGISFCSTEGEILYINKAFKKNFGYSAKELKTIYDWFNKAYPNKISVQQAKERWANHVKQVQQEHISTTHELVLVAKNGAKKNIEIKTSYSNGFIYNIFIDLTEKRSIEAKAKETALKFKRIIENFPVPMASCDLQYNLLFVNNKFREVFGYELDEIKLYPAWFKKIQFDSPEAEAEHDTEFYGYLKEVQTNPEKIAPVLYRQIYNKKGELRDINIIFNLFDNELFAILEDVTEQNNYIKLLQESEERFKALAQNMPIAIGSYNTDGTVNFINNYFTKTIGYVAEDLPTIEYWYYRTQPDPVKRKQYYEHWVALIDAFSKNPQQEIPYLESDITCKDGSIKTFSYLFSIYKKTVYIIFVDVTERKKAEKELIASHIQLQRLSAHQHRTKEQERKFIAEHIHDTIGQQITGIKIDLTVLKNKIQKTDPGLAEKINHDIEIANSVILAIRKMAADLRPSILDDFGLAAAIEWECREFEKRTGIHCFFEYDNSLKNESAELQSNLYRIVQEALLNIDKHAKANKIIITLSKLNGEIMLSIKDNGNGYDWEKKNKSLAMIGIKDRARNLKGNCTFQSMKGAAGGQLLIKIPANTTA